MSSRLPYASPEFETAAQSAETLAQWEQQQWQHFQERVKKATLVADLLAAAEAAIRCQDAPAAQALIEKALNRAPQEADAHYLQAMLWLGLERSAEALDYLKTCVPRLSSKTPDHARVHALLAQQLLQQEQALEAAASTLSTAFELAGGADFVHCTTRPASELSRAQLDFDLELFEALWPWDQSPLRVRFSAVHTDAQDQVYVLEHRQRWLFSFDAQGQFLRGLSERDLAGTSFIFPELGWDLTDIATQSPEQRYLCGSSDRIYVFDQNWERQRELAPPASQRTLRPLSLALDSEQNLFVVYLHLGGIHWFNPEGYHLGAFGQNTIMPSLGKNYFCGIATNPQNQVCLFDRDQVQIFEPGKAEPLHSFSVSGISAESMDAEDYPFCWNGIAASREHIFVCDTYGHRVFQLDVGTGQSEALAGLELLQPFDVAVDSQGALYIADTGHGRVIKFQAQTQQVLLGHPAFQGVVST